MLGGLPFPLVLQAGCPFQTLTSFQKRPSRHHAAMGSPDFRGEQREPLKNRGSLMKIMPLGRREEERYRGKEEGRKGGRLGSAKAPWKVAAARAAAPAAAAAALKEAFPCTDDRVGDSKLPSREM